VDKSDAWTKKTKPKKIQVVHKTYEEIVKEAGLEGQTHVQAGVGPIIDATGAAPREVSSIAELTSASWTPSTDSMRIAEIRHNIRLMVDMTNQDLHGLAREGRLLEEKRKKDRLEEIALSKKVKEEAELIRRMGELKIVVDELGVAVKEAQQVQRQNKMQSSDYESAGVNGDRVSALDSLSLFVEQFTRDFAKEYDSFRVDEILVGAISPLFTAEIADWKPLEHPAQWSKTLRLWSSALKMSKKPKDETALVRGFYGADVTVEPQVSSAAQTMTPWEALLWHVWLPKVRSAIK
jgi:tuftelin-interacting protein 11